MPVQKRVSKGLTQGHIDQLKSEGILSLGEDISVSTPDYKFDATKPVEFILNVTDAIVSVGDLETFSGRGLAIPPRSLIFLPHYATEENIRRSAGLRSSITTARSLRCVTDPVSELTSDDLTPRPSLEESLSPGEHLDEEPNPFDKGLADLEAKEAEFEKRVTGRGKRVLRNKGKTDTV